MLKLLRNTLAIDYVPVSRVIRDSYDNKDIEVTTNEPIPAGVILYVSSITANEYKQLCDGQWAACIRFNRLLAPVSHTTTPTQPQNTPRHSGSESDSSTLSPNEAHFTYLPIEITQATNRTNETIFTHPHQSKLISGSNRGGVTTRHSVSVECKVGSRGGGGGGDGEEASGGSDIDETREQASGRRLPNISTEQDTTNNTTPQ